MVKQQKLWLTPPWLAVLMLGVLVLGVALWWQTRELDLLIINGLVVDGTGDAPYNADVAIRAGRIAGVSRWRYRFATARRRINAAGRIVAPGFIDVHTHVEASLPTAHPFKPANFLKQGVTTLITGNCGRSRTDIAEMFDALEKHGTFINVATLIGHNSIRRTVLGQAARAPAPEELQRMEQMVEQGLLDGALGLSTGLAYTPGRFAETKEVIALARAAAVHGGLYVTHIRDEARGGETALKEALRIGREADAVTQISHLKCSGQGQWHTMSHRLALIEAARTAGQRVFTDLYPYDRSSTTTDILLPDWAVAEQRANLRQAALDAHARQRLRADIGQKLLLDGWRDLAHVRLIAGRPEWRGHTLAEAPTPAATLAGQLENLIEVSLRGGAQAIYADMHEDDVATALAAEFSVFGTDSAVRDPESDYRPHPRGSGSFPRIFRHYVRETGQLSLSQAARKASGLAAEIFGLSERGHLQAGEWADVVIFNLQTIEDTADYEQPLAEPRGLDFVIVNGVIVSEGRAFTTATPSGQALRH